MIRTRLGIGRAALILLLAVAMVLLGIAPTGRTTVRADDTGWLGPTSNYATGDGDGFERDPTWAYADDTNYAENRDNGGSTLWVTWNIEQHVYHDYGSSIPANATVEGVQVRLDWWLSNRGGTNEIRVDLSWNNGSNWTSYRVDASEPLVETTVTFGGPSDTWGRSWSPGEFDDANFLVRVHCYSSTTDQRDFYLDWIRVRVTYSVPPPPVGVYEIVAVAGTTAIRVTLRLENGRPEIVSWEVLR